MKSSAVKSASRGAVQPTLENWIRRTTVRSSQFSGVRSCFALDWRSGDGEPRAVWCEAPPTAWHGHAPSRLFRTRIRWRLRPRADMAETRTKEVTLCARWSDEHSAAAPELVAPSLGTEHTYSNVSYLKSHLQKAVRKGCAARAVATAAHYLRLDAPDFLRRLPVIMLEDAALHASLPVVVWLMAACNASEAPLRLQHRREVAEYLLGVVRALCEQPHTRPELRLSRSTAAEAHRAPSVERLLASHGHRFGDVIYALLLRRSYGGMHGDLAMVNRCAELVADGEVVPDASPAGIARVPWDSVPPLAAADWDLDAIDFHCARFLPSLLLRKYPALHRACDGDEEVVRQLMWHNASKRNVRLRGHASQAADRPELWRLVEPPLRQLQRWLLRKNMAASDA